MVTNIKRDDLAKKLDDINLSHELTKQYAPIVDVQTDVVKELQTIKESAEATTNALQSLPAAIQFPQYPAIKGSDPIEDIRTLELGGLAAKYLGEYASNKKDTDTIFGIHTKNDRFYIGESQIEISGDDIQIGEKIYPGTTGRWELVTKKSPDKRKYDDDDLDMRLECYVS